MHDLADHRFPAGHTITSGAATSQETRWLRSFLSMSSSVTSGTPGFEPGYGHAPWYVDPVKRFSEEDEKEFWFLDSHWPRGLTPMGLIWNEDGYN